MAGKFMSRRAWRLVGVLVLLLAGFLGAMSDRLDTKPKWGGLELDTKPKWGGLELDTKPKWG